MPTMLKKRRKDSTRGIKHLIGEGNKTTKGGRAGSVQRGIEMSLGAGRGLSRPALAANLTLRASASSKGRVPTR